MKPGIGNLPTPASCQPGRCRRRWDLQLALLRNKSDLCPVDNYRVIVDGSTTDFAVEITYESGGIQTTRGFRTPLAADAWMADRIAGAEASASYRAKLLRD